MTLLEPPALLRAGGPLNPRLRTRRGNMKAGTVCRIVTAALLLAASPLAAEPAARGVARDASQQPLPGARVELLAVPTRYEQGLQRLAGRQGVPVSAGTTDAHGRFALTTVRPGLFTVRIAAPGKVPLVFGPLPLVEEMDL